MTFKLFLSLTRAPAGFSAMGNAYAGYWLGGGMAFSWPLLLSMVASGFFLLGGMALNDVADAKVDAEERPSRPIPSGAITRGGATFLGLGLLTMGLVLEYAAGWNAFVVALGLCTAILAYNFLLKGGIWGPASMGVCRALNLATGFALSFPVMTEKGTGWPLDWTAADFNARSNEFLAALQNTLQPSQVWGIFSLWFYIVLVTFLARDEVQGNSLRRSRIFFGGLGLWSSAWIMVGLSVVVVRPGSLGLGLLACALLASQLFHPLRRLWHEPSPAHTGKSVGTLLRIIPLVDMLALIAAGVAWHWTLGLLAFMIPGALMMRKIKIT